MRNGVVTLQHIAEIAGVTAATVSLSLNNSPEISRATRARIVAIARQLGYRPNPYVSALMRSRRQRKPSPERPTIAMVNAESTADGWRNSLSATLREMHRGAMQRAEQLGYKGEDFWLHQDGMPNERFSDMLYVRGIQGLLLSPLPDNTPPPALRWEHFTSVSLSVPFKTLTLPTVCNDHYFSSFRAVHECHRLGYRRPGLVLRKSHHDRFHGRWDGGFSAACDSLRDITAARTLLIESWDEIDALAAWLNRETPDVVIALNAENVEQHLRTLGLRVPQDIGVASLSSPKLGDRLSGIYQNARLTGARAIELLVSMMERHETGLPEHAFTVMIEGHWNNGRTLRPQESNLPTAT